MSKLLNADFVRMRKHLLFWVCIIVMFLFGTIGSADAYREAAAYNRLETVSAENAAFGFNLLAGILTAAFCSIFLGEEYASGVFRNKIIAGHSRESVYLSGAVTCMAAGVLMCIAYIVPSYIIGTAFLGGFRELPPHRAAGYYLVGILMTAACAALFSAVTVIVEKRNASAAACLIIVLLIMYSALLLHQSLKVPEYGYMFSGENVPAVYGKLPNYLEGNKREFVKALFDISPAGQAYQLTYRHAENLPRMAIASAVICALSLLAGTAVFTKKDLK